MTNRKTALLRSAALVAIAALTVFMSSCGLLTARLGDTKPKEFSKAGLSITLDDSFTEEEMLAFTAYYQTSRCFVSTIKEEFSLFEDAGISTDIPLDDYAQMVMENSSITPLITYKGVEKSGFTFNNEANGKKYFYYATVRKGTDAFWLIQFCCADTDKTDFFPRFESWADTIKVD